MKTAGDRLGHLMARADAAHLPRATTIADLMVRDVATCTADDTAERAAQLMWDRCCGAVVVVDERGAPIAILTDRDVCMAAYTQGLPLARIEVASAMSKHLHVARARQTIEDAETVMRRHRVRRLPTVDELGELVGLLSLDDVFACGYAGDYVGRDGLSAPAMAAAAAAVGYSRLPEPSR